MRPILLVVFLSGCGPAPETWQADCMFVEVPNDLIEAGRVINHNNMENSANLAMTLFDGRYGKGEFCNRARTITVRMMPHAWHCGLSDCQGEFIPWERRVKVITGSALLHEFIHVQETYLKIDGTITHKGWELDGQYALAEQYERRTQPWWH